MFGQSKPVVLESSYGSRRRRGGLPRWLVLMVIGVALGALGVVVVQERYLPRRLSATESAHLRTAYESADAERGRLQRDLGDATRQLNDALAEKKRLGDELASARTSEKDLRGDLATLVASLPPDPRGGVVEVRAAQFSMKDGVLAYDMVLTRERSSTRPLNGVVQLTVVGQAAGRNQETSVALKPIALTLASHEVLRGSEPLPEGFQAREATIEVLDKSGNKALGRRVMRVR